MPWWGKNESKSDDDKAANNASSSATPFDPNKLPAREKLPTALQKIVDKADEDESFFDTIVDGWYVFPERHAHGFD